MIHGVLSSPQNALRPLLVAAFVTFATVGTHAQVSLESPAAAGRRIVRQVDVVFKGAATMDPARVRAQMSTREGEPYTDESVERDLRTLYATGAVENVDIQAVNVAGGVRVVVTISGRGGIGEIGFLGNAAFDNDKLRKEIEVKVGDPVDDAKLSAAQQKILEMYQKKGFSDVLVTYDVTPSSKEGFSSVLFKVEEGGRGLIGDIRFEGNNAISARTLKSKLTSKEKTFWRLWGKAGKLDNQAVLEDVRKIEQAYQDEGYVYVKVGYRREAESDTKVALVFEITEGTKYDVAAVTIEGITIFSQDELTPAILTEAGFAYSGSDVRGDEKMIQDYYGSRGYADARVETRLSDAGPGKLNVTYSVYEGTKSFIRKVNISGNMKTKDEVIRRELPFSPGDELNTVQMETAQTRLENLNYFEGKGEANPLTVRPVSTEVDGFKDIEVNVAEKPTGSVNFGAGFSSIDSIVGFIDVTQTNFDITDWGDFRGAGQRFNMNIRYGPRRQDFNLSFTEPWFLGQKLAFTTELFYRNMFYLSQANRYEQTNAGLSLGLRKPIGENAYFETTYTLQSIDLNVQDDEDPSQLIRNEDGEFIQSKVDFGFVHDTRDSVFITRKGHKFEAGLMASGLGGDVEVWGGNIGGQQFFSLPGDTILSFEGMARFVDGWGNSGTSSSDVPIFERLFLGGANNLRGYDYREAGPKDSTGEPIGGNVSLYASIEYSFPIIEKVRGAVFYDVGYVSTDITATNASVGGVKNGGPIVGDGEVYSNIGIGLRMFLPVGPIRLDLGLPLVKDDFTGDSPRFQFNMGYKF
ncbi:outer membrane protein assembly factor BamA [Prosthecobacter dejongeii]|uniref:Outer membrane protein assembly factor BamA n=1 Tax=Prosthecobacter dejongeii TaxID=48465 RepID=A0A7W8DPE1_9BACT|nr:outer membrane protein assembly factor BamA [Prosthecobacter dejongeii]MBB5037338.1 outer membrane protein insertion porin family [Prosthecobacter dejongeii]